MINRRNLVSRHNPVLHGFNADSPLSVGNGELAFTADITGMQSLYEEHRQKNVPLCTMSQWGWHTGPAPDGTRYAFHDVEMTEYVFNGRTVTYPVEPKPGNEAVYNWLRQNPHRLNLARIGFSWQEEEIPSGRIEAVRQELHLYEGILQSEFTIGGSPCRVSTSCHSEKDALAFQIKSPALASGDLKVRIAFPYGASDITASNWEQPEKHSTKILEQNEHSLRLERKLDDEGYFVSLRSDSPFQWEQKSEHVFMLSSRSDQLSFTVEFSRRPSGELLETAQVLESSRESFREFWETGTAMDFSRAKDPRAPELERRIILSQYLLAIQSCGSMPPQETGLTCNSWYGKFHLEMHLWHSAWLPLWGRSALLEKSFGWYAQHLPEAKANAARNGYKGARWPKMVAYDAIDSPSFIAVLLIWQQPHILYMLELARRNHAGEEFIKKYWPIVKETAEFMCDFAVLNPQTGKYDLLSPIIPAQEEHDPRITRNPAFEVEYWRFGLKIALEWAGLLNRPQPDWTHVYENMAELPQKDGLYLAHENCPDTFEKFNRDHPSMLLAYGLIDSDRISRPAMGNTLNKVLECWDFSSMWGWDFALMAMTAVRLGDPDAAVDILLKDTPKNSYVESGNNFQRLRKDLPLYLPGNGSLLLAAALMAGGYPGCEGPLPGFPKNGLWDMECENLRPFPY